MRLWFVRYGLRKGVVMRESTPEDQERAVQWAAGLAVRIQEAHQLPWQVGFPATPGSACKACPFAVQCQILQAQEMAVGDEAGTDLLQAVLAGAVPQGEDLGEAEARELAMRILVAERATQALKDRLRAYVEKHGPVVAGGEQFDIFQRTSWECRDIAGFVAALQEAGEDPLPYLKLDSQKVKKLLQVPLGDVVREYVQEVPEPYFWHKSAQNGNGEE